MEDLEMNPDFWKNKTVFLTGHTGFKGGWLAFLLTKLGASVYGYALEPPTVPSFFTETKLQDRITCSIIGDIRDLVSLNKALKQSKPDIVIHMAAQSLVRESYNFPVETFATNLLGTINLFEASRFVNTVRAIVNVTTDKCYENKEWLWAYRENDRLGGYDPYSASKACAELATSAYHNSFFSSSNIHLASVRAGNVIGGGDWAKDRLIPDLIRSKDAKETLKIRSPNAVRPWQHVLEPLSGYLMLAEKLYTNGTAFAGAWNFGPNDVDAKPVSWIVEQICSRIPSISWEIEKKQQKHEAGLLKLDSTKAKTELGWEPRWNLKTALSKTIDWYQVIQNNDDAAHITNLQIHAYQKK